MKCTDLLIQDHKIILRALDVLQEMAGKVENGEEVEPADIDTILIFLRVFADDCHQAMEESSLFPVLRRAAAAQQRPLGQILFEHDQERSLVEGLEDSLKSGKGRDFVYYANRLTVLLKNHIYKEEHLLFDVVEQTLSQDEDEAVMAEFRKFQKHPGLFGGLHRLEWKYMMRAVQFPASASDNLSARKMSVGSFTDKKS